MFGHSKSQATVGPATVQNPSMLDNVNSDDFEEGASPAVTEVEKQVKEALAAHDKAQVEKTITDDPTVGTTPAPSMMTSGSDVPTAVPASTSDDDDADADDTNDVDFSGATDDAAKDTDEEPVAPASPAEEAPIPTPLSAPKEEAKTDLASTVPGIKVEEASASEEAAEPESPSAPIAPPSAPASTEPEEPAPVEEAPLPEPAVETPAEPEPKDEEKTVEAEVEAAIEPTAPAPEQAPDETSVVDLETTETAVVDEPEESAPESTPAPEEPAPAPEPPAQESADDAPKDSPDVAPVATVASAVPAVDTDKLAGLKKHALDHLEPLADKLDQSPEDEFKTTMMRIQANDNHILLDKALKAAKAIPDDHARAQALLDIVNEINYFSQQG